MGLAGRRLRARSRPRRKEAVFSFLYFFKIKISKIYVRFEIFQKYPRSPPHRATGLKCNFFFQIRNEVPGKKRPCRPPNGRQGPVAQPWGDRGLSPIGGATGPFFSRNFFFPGTYFELFERVFVIIVGKISAANSYRT